jgi:hypothetical protein
MNDPGRCRECQALTEELKDALAGVRAFPDSGEVQAASDKFLAMLREAGEDEERTEELLRKYRFLPQYPSPTGAIAFRDPKMRDVIRRLLEHRARTGHTCGLLRPR